jgi:hypothetical protein
MIKYIDCDGVILDTETGLFDEYNELKKVNPGLKKRQYLHDMDWENWIWQAGVLNDAVYLLKNFDPRYVEILTRVHSLAEARAKINYFRENGVRNNVIVVPDGIMKSSVVDPFQNVLVEDSKSNLEDWDVHHGIPIYYGTGESIYPTVTSLDAVLDDEKFKCLVKRI